MPSHTLKSNLHSAAVTSDEPTTPPPMSGVELGYLPADSLNGISGVVFVQDSRTLIIRDFNYDGQAQSKGVTITSQGGH